MRLVRPFDPDTDVLAIIEDDEWRFEVVVSSSPLEKAFDIVYLDIPTTEEEPKKNATIVVSEQWLLSICKQITDNMREDDDLAQQSFPYTFGPEEGNAIMMFRIKRRAVSLALEDLLDAAEEFSLGDFFKEMGGEE